MITYHEAIAQLTRHVCPIASEWMQNIDALGRVLSEAITSPISVPSCNQSAMDGYALRAEDTRQASSDHPISLTITEIVPAGIVSTYHGEKTAIKIMTGAMIPPGYDTVLMLEDSHCTANTLQITAPLSPGQHVRRLGEDLQAGEHLFAAGEIITPHTLMVCAAVGIHQFLVKRRLTIAHIATGQEIVDNAANPLKPSEVHNSNSPFVHGFFLSAGHHVTYLGQVKDDEPQFLTSLRTALHAASPPDLILSIGAVSKGDFDFIPSALQILGATVLFHGVTIRPGKPILAATIGKTLFIGLPGNPISTLIGCQFFVEPWLDQLLQKKQRPSLTAILKTPISQKKQGFRQFFQASAYLDAQHQLCVDVLQNQASSKVKPLIHTNAWIIIPEEKNCAKVGESVQIELRGALHHV